jgi:hypothetical protein
MTSARAGRSGKWTEGPFTAMTIGQTCHTDGGYIPPGTTAYRGPDGEVRCEAHHDLPTAVEFIHPESAPPELLAADRKTVLRRYRVEAVIYAPSRKAAISRADQANIYLDAVHVLSADEEAALDAGPGVWSGSQADLDQAMSDALEATRAATAERQPLDAPMPRRQRDLRGWTVEPYSGGTRRGVVRQLSAAGLAQAEVEYPSGEREWVKVTDLILVSPPDRGSPKRVVFDPPRNAGGGE